MWVQILVSFYLVNNFYNQWKYNEYYSCGRFKSLQVAEKIQEELEDYRSKEESIKKMKHDMGLEAGSENDAAIGMLSDNTQVDTFVSWLI